jgi:anti-anti-sigma factor
MNISTEKIGSQVTLSFNGRFDHHAQDNFTRNYEPVLRNRGNRVIKLDMSQVNYVDYSALGLLLTLKERAEAVNIELVLGPCSKMAMKIFEATSFLKIFRLLPA